MGDLFVEMANLELPKEAVESLRDDQEMIRPKEALAEAEQATGAQPVLLFQPRARDMEGREQPHT